MDDAQSSPKIKENSTRPPTTDTKISTVTSSLLVDNVVASPSPSMFAAEAAAAVAAAVASSMESKKLFSVPFRRPRTSSEPGPHPPSLSAQHIHPRSSSESKTAGHRTRRASSLLKDVFKDEKSHLPSPTDYKSATIPPAQHHHQHGLDSRPPLSSSPPTTTTTTYAAAAAPAPVTNEAEDQRRNRHQRSRRDRHNLRFNTPPTTTTTTNDLEKQRQQDTTPITIPLSSSLSIPSSSSSSSAPASLQQPAIMKRARAKTMPKLPPELMEKMKEAQVKESTAAATTDGLGREDDSRGDGDVTNLPPKDDGSLPAETDPSSSWAAAAPRKVVDVQPTPIPSSPSPSPSPSSPAPSPRDDNNKKTPPSSSMQRSLSARLISFKDRVARPSSPLGHSSPSSPSLGVTNISENYESVDKVWLRQILKHANDRAIATSILCSALRSPTHPYGIVVAHYATTTNTAIANIIQRAASIDDTEIVHSGGEDDDSSSSDDDDFYTPPPIPTSLQSQYLGEALSNLVADLTTFADSVSETIVMHYEPLRQISRPMEVCKAAIFDAILPSIYTDLILLYNMRFKIMDQRYNDKIASMSTLTPGHLAIRPKLWLIHMPDIPNPGMVAPVIAPSSPSLSSKSGFFSIGSRRTSVSPVSPPPPAKISLPVPPYQPAIEIFKQLAISKNPTRRSQILKHCMDGLQKCVHDHWRGVHSPDDLVIGADDLLPIFTFIVIKSGTKNMHSEMEFHKDFMSEMDASGMEGYLMTTLETSLLLIHELQQEELRRNASSLVDLLMGATTVSSS